MSTFLRLIKGASKSTTVQANGGFLAILVLLFQSDIFTNIVTKNPEWAAIALGIQSLLNILLRFKTNRALADR